MAVLAPSSSSPHALLLQHGDRELWWHRDHHQPLLFQPAAGTSGGCASVSVHGGGGVRMRRGRRRAVVKVRAFWQDLSRPSSVEMEAIGGVEELDEALRRSREQSQPILIDWMAAWCRKCIYLKPKLEKLAAEYYPRVKFYYVDVNNVPQALVMRGNISKMPTIQLWKDGEWQAEIIGGHKAWLVMDEVREMIKKYI